MCFAVQILRLILDHAKHLHCMHNRPADADHTAAVTDKRTGMREGDIAVEVCTEICTLLGNLAVLLGNFDIYTII